MRTLNTAFIIIFISVSNIIIYNGLKEKIEQSQYKVYYEYNVFNNDTIPCDTIFVKLK